MSKSAKKLELPAVNRTLIQSWRSAHRLIQYTASLTSLPIVLPPGTRLAFSLGVCMVGLAGIAISDYIEKKVPATPELSGKS
ncbi:hypothetical protein BDQ12DRAFT_342163 [Crucibulum laeve]|uniref:Uncharacterized protein n=1 Tax=Crucibulum laeve TaxID=68775 RepID=A0A5C3M960_9AGAR|nr:hypothetical protein BDQ12DRAFT_342163 [Crucibulum laeve]